MSEDKRKKTLEYIQSEEFVREVKTQHPYLRKFSIDTEYIQTLYEDILYYEEGSGKEYKDLRLTAINWLKRSARNGEFKVNPLYT